jgi:dolichol-phosphate mannosyltransferase
MTPTPERPEMLTTLVIVPTYNERENVVMIVGRIIAAVPAAHILIVDDSSPDGTGDVADGLAATHGQVNVLHRTIKDGLGGAYKAGFAWGLARGYTALVEMDADGSHHPEQLPRMLELLEGDSVPGNTGTPGSTSAPGNDLVLGSRWVPGGRVENWPLSRTLLSRGGSAYTRAALGINVRDATGGYRVFSAEALKSIHLEDVASQGYCFQVDLLWRALQAGLTVVETPITFTERVIGESKMSKDIVIESLWRVSMWGVRRRALAFAGIFVPSLRPASVKAGYHVELPVGGRSK